MDSIPNILLEKAAELEEKTAARFPALAPLAKPCFLSTIETTVQRLEDGSCFVITGDIPAMWLRDSAAQLAHYVPFAKEDADLRDILRSVIEKQAFYVNLDPYSNAFNRADSGANGGYRDETDSDGNGWVWERKYETDSLCAPIYLADSYYAATGDKSIFTSEFRQMLKNVVHTFAVEQNHAESPYYFQRSDCAESDTLSCKGRGTPVNYTGMTWSGFRPSDDACKYGYLIPSNMMAVVALKRAANLAVEGYADDSLAGRCEELASEIDDGIHAYGIVEHPKYGRIYAYETDGFGNYNLMDDANSPSLLAIPYLGYRSADNGTYQNTRRFLLSPDNPYYFEGKYAKGIGSPHTPDGYIWHISVVMQALTSRNEAEIQSCLQMLADTHAGTNFMHEGFDPNAPENFTRDWFAWANSLLAHLLAKLFLD